MIYGKRILSFVAAFVLVLVCSFSVSATQATGTIEDDSSGSVQSDTSDLLASTVAEPAFTGVASFSVSCNLGDIVLSLPSDVPGDVLQLKNNRLVNVSASTVYLYCEQFPDYTFSASRFGPVSYRANNLQTQELVVYESELISSDSLSANDFFEIFLLVLIAFFLLRGFNF